MRTVVIALATSAAISAAASTPSAAQTYLYCLQSEEYAGGAGDCSFSTYAQCQASAAGRTGSCAPNRNFNANAQLIVKARPRHRSN
ncbi:DUF3551 domain-containing protein [Bradyrhizobium sp. SRL28]|uniref:DUF3551 domain-containing protein n=1 Tax=Bradyrhizobium sp. SRL28 TaxID=2836178 RepID=UPI001BDDDA09|nr:DUF3551 domain-containing protein [Bradyrhizobium sp. SRL28]MBT1511563.1 DUF3551 domain-containing protein [Bradyrhizobium sp. SRL28]